MELLWLFLVAVVTINVSNAKSIVENVTEKEVNKSSVSKVLKPSPYVFATRRNNSVFPNMQDRRGKFVVNLNPTLKTENQTTKTEKYGNRLMKNLPIKYVNYYATSKKPAEITTRRPLMQIRKFTVKPHAVFAESVREKNNWNGNKKMIANNFRKPKSERYTTEKYRNKEESPKQKSLNIQNVDSSKNDNDSEELEKEEQKNNYIAAGSRKSKTIVLFPKENNTKHLKVDSEQKTFKRIDQNKFDSEFEKNGISNEDKEKSVITNKVLVNSEPKDNSSDQEKADRSETISSNDVKKDVSFVETSIISTSPAGVVGKVGIPTHGDLDFL